MPKQNTNNTQHAQSNQQAPIAKKTTPKICLKSQAAQQTYKEASATNDRFFWGAPLGNQFLGPQLPAQSLKSFSGFFVSVLGFFWLSFVAFLSPHVGPGRFGVSYFQKCCRRTSDPPKNPNVAVIYRILQSSVFQQDATTRRFCPPFCSSFLPSFLFRLTVFYNIYAVVRFRDFSTLASRLHCSPSDDLAVPELRKTEVQRNWVLRFSIQKIVRHLIISLIMHGRIYTCVYRFASVCFQGGSKRQPRGLPGSARTRYWYRGCEDHGVARAKRSPSHPQMQPKSYPRKP